MKYTNKYRDDLFFQVGETNAQNLSFEKLRTVFLMAIRDFKSGKLTLEELSWFASELVQMPRPNDGKEMEELKGVILSCSEIGYYLHQIPEVDTNGENTVSFLLETMRYYQKHKKLLA